MTHRVVIVQVKRPYVYMDITKFMPTWATEGKIEDEESDQEERTDAAKDLVRISLN